MDDAAASTADSLKYIAVRACGTCVKAKAKCVPNQGGPKCTRCQRLQKDCRPCTTSRKRNKSSSTAQLEKKLDSLVTILSSSQLPRQEGRSTSTSSRSSLAPNLASHLPASTPNGPNHIYASIESIPGPPHGYAHPSPISVFYSDYVARNEGLLLRRFQATQAPTLYFMTILSDLAALNLRAERPWLWKSVIATASYTNPSYQKQLGKQFLEDITVGMLLRGEKSLDMLQGLLIYIAWFHYYCGGNNQTHNLLYLSKGLLATLGIHKSPRTKLHGKLILHGLEALPSEEQVTDTQPGSATLEEYRALVGVFYANSVCRAEIEAFPYASYTQELCNILADVKEYENDTVIYYLIKLQFLVNKVKRTFNDTTDPESKPVLPTKMILRMLQHQFDDFRTNLPDEVKGNSTVIWNYMVAEIGLYETGFAALSDPAFDSFQRLNILESCLSSVKRFLDVCLADSAEISMSFQYLSWAQISFVLLAAIKLCICSCEGWDTNLVHNTLNLSHILDVLIGKLDALFRDGNEIEWDVFSHFSRQLGKVKAWYDMKFLSKDTPRIDAETHQQASAGFDQQGDYMLSLDENFWCTLGSTQDDSWTIFGQPQE